MKTKTDKKIKTIKEPTASARRRYALELPIYESLVQMSGATGIPLAVLKRAKRQGAQFTFHGRYHLRQFLDWCFSQRENADAIDVPMEQARIIREQRRKLERENRVADGQLANIEECKEAFANEFIIPFKTKLFALARAKGIEYELIGLLAEFQETK
jgi:hypothetical protein